MEHTNEHKDVQQSTFDLIKNEIENFRVRRNRNLWCEESLSCAGTILAEKLVKILEDEKAETRKRTVPMGKALSNSVVVRKILSYLDVRSLLRFRQVSRLWREEATSFLLFLRRQNRNEEFPCVKFTGVARHGGFRHKTGKTLETFVAESAGNPQLLIYSGFIFRGESYFKNYTCQILSPFFSQHGHHIQHLNLSLEQLKVEEFRHIFLKWTPNLKSLVLDPRKWWVNSRNENTNSNGQHTQPHGPFSLSKLRKITLPTIQSHSQAGWTSPSDLIRDLLTSAPNLTCIEDPRLVHITQIISAGKVSLVKSLTWSFSNMDDGANRANFNNFLATSPKLTSLTLEGVNTVTPRPDPQFVQQLFNLLVLGQNTLEKVTGVQKLGQNWDPTQPPNIQLLPLVNLTQLKVGVDGAVGFPQARPTILPQGLRSDLSEIAPNLKYLHLRSIESDAYPFTSQANAHAALQKLKISIMASNFTSPRMRQWVETLGGHYPNITHLHISNQYKGEEIIPEFLRLIPHFFKQLEQLIFKLTIDRNLYDEPTAEWNFDEALTGFSKEVCNKLENPVYQKSEILDQIRTSPSIIDLKKLTNLKFEVKVAGKPRPLWSHLTQLYAFQPMAKRQGLQVKVVGLFSSCFPLTGNELGPI